ncbi:MAG: hypothetical protein FJY97_05780 [candidate division Zixibacteria bacterium]|nr:hypothetical protein [candidate division Zixibacteria bacterium]
MHLETMSIPGMGYLLRSRTADSGATMLGITSIRQLIGYTVAAIMMIFGIMILIGMMRPIFLTTDRLRLIFGIVLILFSIFRFASAYFAERRQRETILEDDSWKGPSASSSGSSE